MTPEIQQLLYSAVASLIAVIMAVLGYYSRLLLVKVQHKVENSIGKEQYDWLYDYIFQLVHAVKQNPAFKDYTNENLKAYVLSQAMLFVENNKMPFTQEQIDALIESAVYYFKKEAEPSETSSQNSMGLINDRQ